MTPFILFVLMTGPYTPYPTTLAIQYGDRLACVEGFASIKAAVPKVEIVGWSCTPYTSSFTGSNGADRG